MTAYRDLSDGWTLSGGDIDGVAATVPGCVHTDLLAAGLIADPYLDANEAATAWIGRTTWTYATTFEHSPGAARSDLVCRGLDTVATVTLNGVVVGRTENMHRGYRFDVTEALRDGANELTVTFGSAYDYAEAQRERLGALPNAYPEPFNFIRKQACNFGWDWGPTLVTAGIWQAIGLHDWTGARLAEVRPQVTVDGGRGHVAMRVRLERTEPGPATLTMRLNGRSHEVTTVDDEVTLSMTVDDPDLWWPVGHGDQPLYPVTVELGDEVWRREIGFRSVELDTSGGGYTLVVNGRPVFVRGVNWIPDDVFANRVTRDRLRERFDQALGANVNYLRVWGGGRYESEDFYELADRLGLMVGQDFLFACAAYPEEEPFASEVAAEAREQVVRLASHPSLLVWTGNNENLWGYEDWGWKPLVHDRTWGRGFYLSLLPGIVAAEDPSRPYWPGSPWSGSDDEHPNAPELGTTHIWDVWNTDDYTKYREYRPRFAGEFGYQAPPAYATLRRALSDEPLAPDSPGMRAHQKAADGDAKLQRGLDAHLPAPRDFDDWHYLTQVNQARALSLGIEHFRSLWPHCSGAVMWQLNDCWPVTSWAAVDGDGRRKPLWYALRRSYAPRLLTIQPRDGIPTLVAINDTDAEWELSIEVARRTLSGFAEATEAVGLTVAPRATTAVAIPAKIGAAADATRELIVATAGEHRALWFFAEDKDIAWPPAEYDATVTPAGDVTVTARSILRDLTLFPDRLDPSASTDNAAVTLLPGESVTFRVNVTGLDATALTTRPVLRCVNDLTTTE